jgi:hypothetical protein
MAILAVWTVRTFTQAITLNGRLDKRLQMVAKDGEPGGLMLREQRLRVWAASPLLVVLAGLASIPALVEAGGWQEPAELIVTVQLSGGGAVRQPRPLSTEVQVAPAGDAGVQTIATARTGPDGTGSLTVPAGHYWVFVPVAAGEELRVAAQTVLPNGVPVSGWAEVDLAPGATQTITVTLRNMAP